MDRRVRLGVIALLCALMMIVHWRGAALILTGVLFLVSRRRLVDAVLFGLVAGVPPGIILLMNYLLAGNMTGAVRPDAWYTVAGLVTDYSSTLRDMIAWIGVGYAAVYAVTTFGRLVLHRVQRLYARYQHERGLQRLGRQTAAAIADPADPAHGLGD